MAHQERHPVEDPAGLDTELIDLSERSVEEILSMSGDQLTPFIEKILKQTGNPRFNVGGSGPPGRVD
jgi:hypothetical protein